MIFFWDDIGLNNFCRLCHDCGQIFDSHFQYEKHKKKELCCLIKYGCKQQIDSCSLNKHLSDQNHIHALQLCLIRKLGSSIDLNLVKDLTECLSRNNNNNVIVTTVDNDEQQSIDTLLALDFGTISITHQIEKMDNSSITKEEEKDLLQNQLKYTEQIANFIPSQFYQTDEQQDNLSILEQQTTISTMLNQFQVCHLCEKEYNISLTHHCQISVNELQEKANKFSIEIKQLKEMNEILINLIQRLDNDRNMLDIALLNIPNSKNGLLIWLIKNISNEIVKSHSPSKRFIDSPTFLSLTGEHPLNIRLFLRGDSFDYPNYISIHVILSFGGNNNLSIPLTCCLVDQTNSYQHQIEQAHVNLRQENIGTIFRFSQFLPTIDVHKEGSRFVDNDTLCLIVKLHENESNQYNHYPVPIQNALQQINSLTFK